MLYVYFVSPLTLTMMHHPMHVLDASAGSGTSKVGNFGHGSTSTLPIDFGPLRRRNKREIRSRPKFGFGAESGQMASFGVVSVSAEVRKLPFGFLSVSAETDIDPRSSAEGLFQLSECNISAASTMPTVTLLVR